MSEENSISKDNLASRHRFIIMIAMSIITAAVLVSVSLALYYNSGAHQLDLSRPGYAGIREKVLNEEKYDSFSADGDIDEATLDTFSKEYSARIKELDKIDAFSGDVLSPTSLQLDK